VPRVKKSLGFPRRGHDTLLKMEKKKRERSDAFRKRTLNSDRGVPLPGGSQGAKRPAHKQGDEHRRTVAR